MDLSCVTVIIPALNEEAALPLVLRDLPPVGRVIVVDNGSTNTTAQGAEAAAGDGIQKPRRGYGSACLAGLTAIADSVRAGQAAPRIVAFVDADYSDHPQLLPDLVA